jgi:hypothetical protein
VIELKRLCIECENHNKQIESFEPNTSLQFFGQESKMCHLDLDPSLPESSNRDTLIEAFKLASEREEMVIICGSAFIMSDVRNLLGIKEPRD